MTTVNSICRTVRPFVVAVALCLVASLPVWAQVAAEEPAGKTSWVLPYALVVLGVGLGIVAVCRPGKRTAELRRRAD